MASPTWQVLLNTDNKTVGGVLTPTIIDALPLLKAQVGRNPADATQDAELTMLIFAAMDKYNEIAPPINRTTITTQNGKMAYPLPGDCVKVYDVQVPSQYGYFNDFLFLPMIDTPASTLFGYSDYAFRAPSERFIREGILGELDHYAQSFSGWLVDGIPPQLYILPTPTTDGLTSAVRYGAQHVNQNTTATATQQPTFTTLPTGHYRHVIQLMKWALADARADRIISPVAMTNEGMASAALTESWKLGNRADRILQQVRSALGADVGVALRS